MNNQDNRKIDLAVAYRIYPKVSKIPPVFADDKFKLAELCLRSFRKSLGALNIKLYAILDNCPAEYEDLFRKYFDENELVIINKPGIGNQQTFNEQIEILLNQSESEYIYFAEDDYFYLDGAFPEMLEVMKSGLAGFVTPYDHLDYYTHPLHQYKSKLLFFGKRHWRTGATTCMTFLTTKTILKSTLPVFKSYVKNNYDTSLWLALTKIRILNPFFNLKMMFISKEMMKVIAKCWLHTPFANLFGQKHQLLVPIPTLSTHLDSKCLAPGTDWEQQFSSLTQK